MRPILFCHLCVGEHFLYDGREYRKTAPTVAELQHPPGELFGFDPHVVVEVTRV